MTENRYEYNVVNRINWLKQLIKTLKDEIKEFSDESWKLDVEITEITKVIG